MRAIIDRYKLMKLKSSKNAGYSDYLEVQYQRSKSKLKQKSALELKRKEFLVGILSSKIDLKNIKTALILGCRDSHELNLLEKFGVQKTIGVDLFSTDSRVRVMDMQELNFDENSFDLIYASHVLEHAFDYHKVLDRISNVIRDGGIIVIEVPANFKTTTADLHDFRSISNLIRILEGHLHINKIIHEEYFFKSAENNFCGTDGMRLIAEIGK